MQTYSNGELVKLVKETPDLAVTVIEALEQADRRRTKRNKLNLLPGSSSVVCIEFATVSFFSEFR